MCAQLCPTLCDPRDYSPPGSSVHGISQERILEWVAISYSRGSSWPRDRTHISCIFCIGRQILYHWAIWVINIIFIIKFTSTAISSHLSSVGTYSVPQPLTADYRQWVSSLPEHLYPKMTSFLILLSLIPLPTSPTPHHNTTVWDFI